MSLTVKIIFLKSQNKKFTKQKTQPRSIVSAWVPIARLKPPGGLGPRPKSYLVTRVHLPREQSKQRAATPHVTSLTSEVDTYVP
jgi:hypothetical protein